MSNHVEVPHGMHLDSRIPDRPSEKRTEDTSQIVSSLTVFKLKKNTKTKKRSSSITPIRPAKLLCNILRSPLLLARPKKKRKYVSSTL